MYFETITALIEMEGHGPYVWFSYGVGLLVLGGLLISARLRRRQLSRLLAAAARRNAHFKGEL